MVENNKKVRKNYESQKKKDYIEKLYKIGDYYNTSQQTELIQILSKDVEKYMEDRKNDDNQTNRRGLIRSIFSHIEGNFSYLRNELYEMEVLKPNPVLSMYELIMLKEKSIFIDKKGQVKKKSNYMRLNESVKYSVNCFCKVYCIDYQIDYNSNEWDCFMKSIDVRHRITHPKRVSDLNVSDKDIERVDTTFLFMCEILIDLFIRKMEKVGDGSFFDNYKI